MNVTFHPDDIEVMARVSGRSQEELEGNKQLVGAYHRWLSIYHVARGSGGPLGPVLLTAMLGSQRLCKAPSEREADEIPVDWSLVEVGEIIEATLDTSPPQVLPGQFILNMGDGTIVVRLKGESAHRIIAGRRVKIRRLLPPGIDSLGFGVEPEGEPKPEVLAAIESRAVDQQREYDEYLRQKIAEGAPDAPLDGDYVPPPVDTEEAAAERAELTAPLPPEGLAVEAEQPRRRGRPPKASSGEPDDAEKVRESPWLHAEAGHKAVILHDGDWIDAEFALVTDSTNPDDVRVQFWVDDLNRGIELSEHEAKPKSPLPTPEASYAAGSDL